MKGKCKLIGSIFQLLVGLFAILLFVVLRQSGENMTKWIITLFLAFGYVVLGVIGIIDYISDK